MKKKCKLVKDIQFLCSTNFIFLLHFRYHSFRSCARGRHINVSCAPNNLILFAKNTGWKKKHFVSSDWIILLILIWFLLFITRSIMEIYFLHFCYSFMSTIHTNDWLICDILLFGSDFLNLQPEHSTVHSTEI